MDTIYSQKMSSDPVLKEQLKTLFKYLSEPCWETRNLKALFDKSIFKVLHHLQSTTSSMTGAESELQEIRAGYRQVFINLLKAFKKNKEMENIIWEWTESRMFELVDDLEGALSGFMERKEVTKTAIDDARSSAQGVELTLEKVRVRRCLH
jgi:hypothetical protein